MMPQEIIAMQREFPNVCTPRPLDSHKGTFGTLGVIGGSIGMSGAPVLSGKAGLKMGAGKVFIGFSQPTLPLPLLPDFPELMLSTADDLLERSVTISAWSFGSGLGVTYESNQLLTRLLALNTTPIVLDADALTLLAKREAELIAGNHQWILTPHPQEAATLLGTTVAKVQKDRRAAVLAIARKYQALVVLKGYRTLIATPESIIWKNETGNPGLSTAGTGDVLAGFISGLLAQSISLEEAASAAVWLHGKAADSLVERGIGPIGLTASELIDEARRIRNHLTYTK